MSIFEPGDVIDRYVVESLLGQGGMAAVYRVRHKQLGTIHALKVLTVPNPNIRERLIREGRIQASIKHPNIVAVQNVVESGGHLGLLMEYVAGPSLEQLMDVYQPTEEEALALYGGILRAVHAAHAQDLAHRDLKPANVLLQFRDEGIFPLVTDFGIAKVIEGETTHTRATTKVGATMGTPEYMAPEQIHDASSADERADLWSLGVILYELISAQRPFYQERVLDILNAVSNGQFTPLEDLAPQTNPNVLAAVEACLETDRNRRIGDTRALAAILAGRQVMRPIDELFENHVSWEGPLAAQCMQLRHATPVPVPARETSLTDESVRFEFNTQEFALPPQPIADFPSSVPAKITSTRVIAGGLAASAGLVLFLFGGVFIGIVGMFLWFQPGSTDSNTDVVATRTVLVEKAPPVEEDRFTELAPPQEEPRVTETPSLQDTDDRTDEGPTVLVRKSQPKVNTGGTVSVEGDATNVVLVGKHGTRAPGQVPAGTWAIQATFDDETVEAGSFTVEPGQSVTIRCAAAWYQCKVVN